MKSLTPLPATPPPTTDGVFYGWFVVGAVFIILMVSSGLGFYNASVILTAGKEELDASLGVVSVGPSLFFGISGIAGFLLAKKMNEVDLRWFYLVGGIIGAGSLYGLRWVDTVPKLYLFFAAFGLAFAFTGLVPSTTLVARWFDQKRTVALSIASTGLSMGGIAVLPFAKKSIENDGLAAAGGWMSVVWFLGIVPLALVFLRNFPSDRGLEPDGAPQPPKPVAVRGATFAEARSTPFFRWLRLTYAMIFLAQVGAIAHLNTLVTERAGAKAATLCLSVLAFTSVVGRLAGGVVAPRVGTKNLTAALTILQSGALVSLALAGSAPMLVASVVLLGASVGNLLMLQPLLLAEAFGVKEYSRIYSLSQLFGTIGVAGGPFFIGMLHDGFNYRTAFICAAGANVIGFVALMLAGPTSTAQKLWNDPSPTRAVTPPFAQSARA